MSEFEKQLRKLKEERQLSPEETKWQAEMFALYLFHIHQIVVPTFIEVQQHFIEGPSEIFVCKGGIYDERLPISPINHPIAFALAWNKTSEMLNLFNDAIYAYPVLNKLGFKVEGPPKKSNTARIENIQTKEQFEEAVVRLIENKSTFYSSAQVFSSTDLNPWIPIPKSLLPVQRSSHKDRRSLK